MTNAFNRAQAMRGLREQLVLAGQEHANGENAELAGILNSVCPALKTSPNMAEKVDTRHGSSH
jgi:hypothetical protein